MTGSSSVPAIVRPPHILGSRAERVLVRTRTRVPRDDGGRHGHCLHPTRRLHGSPPAGGHVRGQVGLLPLLDAVLEAVDVPVVAAGGIATAREMAAVVAAGAAAARVGTRFVATAEADAHPSYVDALVGAGPEDTVLTT